MKLLAFKITDIFSEPTYASLISGALLILWMTFRNKHKNRQSALLEAASIKDLEKFKNELSKKSVDVNQINLNRHTPLILATIKFGQKYLIEELLDKGAFLNWQDIEGNTALHYAVDRNKKALVKFYIEKSADTSLVNQYGQTPLDLAKENGNIDLVELFQ